MGKLSLHTESFHDLLAEIPPDFQGVADVQTDAGQIVVCEQGSARQVRVAGGLS